MSTVERPPIVAILGHVDHGKSSLLDYIRKSNVVAGEAGGITQHIAAYEITTPDENGVDKKITFIDTPGHAAFSGMRKRGANIADIAILIISAEDSIKPQTKESIKILKDNNVPFVVAINKIDKPNANPEKVKMDLMEHEVFLEGLGGDTPFALISAKTGQGIPDLLETILLLAELEEFTGNPDEPATGFVVESHQDAKRGTTATLIIKNGTLTKGQYVVSGCGMASTRMLEDFSGKPIDSATFSSPIQVVGFSHVCSAGSEFSSHSTKKGAEEAMNNVSFENYATCVPEELVDEGETTIVPIVVKADVVGSLEALIGEIEKQTIKGTFFKIVNTGVGDISEVDVKLAATDENGIIIGFHVGIDSKIDVMNERDFVEIKQFDIIYKMSEWLEEEATKRKFRKKIEETTAKLKILKHFSSSKDEHLSGGEVTEGELLQGGKFKLIRKGEVVGRGKVVSMQVAKMAMKKVEAGNQCGMQLKCNETPQEHDILEQYKEVIV